MEKKEVILHIGPQGPDCCGKGVECPVDDARAKGAIIRWFLAPDEVKKAKIGAGEVVMVWDSDDKIKTWMHNNIDQFKGGAIHGDPERQQSLAMILKDVLELYNFDTDSMKFLTAENTAHVNAFKNFKYLESGLPFKKAKDSAKDCVAIIIAGGPSLDKMWDDLLRIRHLEKTIFIVCGRSYRAAMNRRIGPDFVLEVEQFEWDDKIFMFAPMPDPHSILAFPLTCCAGVPAAWPGPKMVLPDHNMAKMLERDGYKIGEDSMDGGNSIAHFMFNLAVHVGCKEVCFAGLDFGYPDGEEGLTHAAESFHPWPPGILMTENTHQSPAMAVANDGQPLRTSPPYINFGTYMEIIVHKAMKRYPERGLKVYNFSARALKMNGIGHLSIDEWSEKWLKQLQDSSAQPSSQPASSPGSSIPSTSSKSTNETLPWQ